MQDKRNPNARRSHNNISVLDTNMLVYKLQMVLITYTCPTQTIRRYYYVGIYSSI